MDASSETDNPPALFAHVLTAIKVLIGILMLSAIAINFANVIARRLFDAPFIWAEEILVFIIVWMVYAGAVLISWQGKHLAMDLVSSRLRGLAGVCVQMLSAIILMALSIFVVSHSYGIILTFMETGQRSIAADIPMYVPHLAIPLGFVLVFIATILRTKRDVTLSKTGNRGDT